MSGDLILFGEVLFDHFPDGRRVLGGAPFNVAWHLEAFGQSPCLISRVGCDEEGRLVRNAMRDWGMRTDFLQTDPDLATGRVSVSLRDGEPTFDIEEPSAWDAISADAESAGASLFYHGTLALRGASAGAETELVRALEPEIIFLDVNLRPPWWQPDQVRKLVDQAHWVKLNQAELKALQGSDDARSFMQTHDVSGLILTHGADGAEIMTAAGESVRALPDAGTRIVDTVGAGDAFASVVILGLIEGWPLEACAERAQAFAGAIVGQRGATVSDRAFYRRITASWQ
jgi:fructokinase